eukprot:EG_transcript_3787
MWSLGPHCHTLLRGYRFVDPQREADFQARYQHWDVVSVRVYVTLALAVCIIGLIDYSRYFFPLKPGLILQFIILAVTSLFFATSFCSRLVRRHVLLLFSVCCCFIASCSCYLMSEDAVVWGQWALDHYVPALAKLPADSVARQQAERFIHAEVATEAILSWLLYSYNHWVFLALLGFNRCTAVCYVVVYISLSATLLLDPTVKSNTSKMAVVIASLASATFLCVSILMERLRRTTFLNEALLTREMQASQMADSMLNHTLKNLLADVAASLEVYLAGEAPSGALEDSVTCLRRGMMACKERQVYLKLVSGQYAPVTQEVNLRSFGRELSAGRNVQLEAVDLSVYLDSTICHLILENALSNAIRHGDPQNPQVKLLIEAVDQEVPSDTGYQRVRFTVENVANPARPPLTPEAVARLFEGQANLVPRDHIPTLSDRVGIAHCVMAAQLGGLSLSLQQEGYVVRFSATLDAPIASQPSASVTLAWSGSSLALQFPTDLCFCCLDDSQAALRLLDLHIRRWCSPASVHLFGHSEEDVPRFVPFALEHADVVILDQQLEFSGSYRGTDLVRELRGKGFAGLVCIRSADDAAQDQAHFYRAGAHCCFGKDVPGSQMMNEVKAAYVQLRRGSSPGLLEDQTPAHAESVSSGPSAAHWSVVDLCRGFEGRQAPDPPQP